ncbi:MAG: hypothetical protein C0617_02305 [Desulfuromonas sp.]|uniref:hypothetical protein n=1 Tax=Desulfuromonas sp. TaxID=892 RepID=UPI000CBC7A83|nr:hypothetical protein [Desulfuromonas sp.]PLX85992.1 MAG: hypothetical protein C0617_02305 [Desulfuromonas sp.]
MGVVFWIVAVGVVVFGYFSCRKLKDLEEEIRGELRECVSSEPETEIVKDGSDGGGAEAAGPESDREPPPIVVPEDPVQTTIEERILEVLREHPGILQTDLYPLFPNEPRRRFQGLLREMDAAGALSRIREGGTFRLHPGK